MWWWALIAYVVVVSVFVMSALKVGSDADDRAEREFEEYMRRRR